MTHLPYSPDIERAEADEQESIDGIIKGMSQETAQVAARDGHAVRASHAKSSACVLGELTVASGLPVELAQGLFAQPGAYQVAVRLAQGPGEKLGDRVSTHRGMAIKIFGVEGEKLFGHTALTHDFVLATGTTFPAGTAAGFLSQAKKIGLSVPMPEAFKGAVSAAARTYSSVLESLTGKPSPTADFYGHPFSHPLAEAYFSQVPVRWGDYVAKVAAFPVAPAQGALKDWRLDPATDENGFRHAAVAYFAGDEAVYELRAQLWTDADAQPIEDASVEWPEDKSPFRTVATLRLPAQAAYGEARVRYFEETMTYSPAHSLAAHRPLGGVMRARLQVYAALSALRHASTGVRLADTATISEIPA